MKIFYVTNARLPTEKAHGLATVKLSEAFAAQGAEVTIFAPWRLNPLQQDAYGYYGVKRNFRIRYLPSIDFLWLGFGKKFFFLVQLYSFSLVAAAWLLFRYGLMRGLADVILFSHDHVPLFFASFVAPRIVYDIHRYPTQSYRYTRVLRRALTLAVQTRFKADKLREDFGVPAGKIVYWPNGTDPERFDLPLGRAEARATLGLPQGERIVLYSGSLQSWKGVETVIAAVPYFSSNILLYIVGGTDAEIRKFQIPNSKFQIRFVGQRPWAEVPVWLKAADVLVLPNTARDEESLHYTSPMKLFEYMASGRPIVASDIPSIREIADESMVFFAVADNPQSLASAIEQALTQTEEAESRARVARREVAKYTWNARARKILAAIGH